jgi:hypothetical protein
MPSKLDRLEEETAEFKREEAWIDISGPFLWLFRLLTGKKNEHIPNSNDPAAADSGSREGSGGI